MTIHTHAPALSLPLSAFAHLSATTTLPYGPREPLRAALEAHVEACIAILDALDGDPDLEDGADLEPGADAEVSLGSPDRMINQENWSRSTSWLSDEDREFDECDLEDDGAS